MARRSGGVREPRARCSDVAAASALWQPEIDGQRNQKQNDQAQSTLSNLLRSSMLEWNEVSKRYRLHDLMRDFARARLTVEPRAMRACGGTALAGWRCASLGSRCRPG